MAGRNIPRAGEIYRHFKNKLYQIVTVATHTETGEQLVVYEALYDDFKMYARPLSMFLSEVDHKKYPEVAQFYRFELVEREIDGTLRMGYPIKVKELIRPEKKEPKKVQVFKEKEKLDMSSIVREAEHLKKQENVQEADKKNLSENEISKAMGQRDGAALKNNMAEIYGKNHSGNPSMETAGGRTQTENMFGDDITFDSGQELEKEETAINPFLLEFLDTDTYSEKLQVLVSIRSRLDDRLIDDMATAIDVTIDEGPLPVRYEGLKTCLETRMKFECERLR